MTEDRKPHSISLSFPLQGILIILGLLVTLVAFSLVLGLIYFWCPQICTCCCQGKYLL
jgi:hypothetical protein